MNAVKTASVVADNLNLLRLLELHSQANPDKPALVDAERGWSFAQLNAEVARSAGALRASGLQIGDRLGVCLRDHADHLIIRFAAARAGITVLPMDWRLPMAERAGVAAQFRLAAVFTEANADIAGVRCLTLDDTWRAQVACSSPTPFIDNPDLPLVLNLSSGTTGAPKAAIVSHRNYHVRIRNNVAVFGSAASLRYLSASPLYFSAGSHFCLTTLLQGGTVVLYPPLFGAEEYVEAVRDNGISMAFLVPTALRWLIALPNDGTPLLPSLEVLLSAAAPLTAEERRQIVARVSPNLYDMFGSAGGGVIATLCPAEIASHADTVGKAWGDVELEVVDDDGKPQGSGATGRVRLRGAGVATAWFETDDAVTGSETVSDGWLYTGDLGSLDAAGYLTLKGRADDVIVRGGVNVYPDVVETALRRCAGVIDAGVVGRAMADGDPEIIAFVLPAADQPASESALHAHCRSVLPSWMQPAEIHLVNHLPRTTSGKIRRRDLLS